MRDSPLRAHVASWMLAFASMTHGRSPDQRRGVSDVEASMGLTPQALPPDQTVVAGERRLITMAAWCPGSSRSRG